MAGNIRHPHIAPFISCVMLVLLPSTAMAQTGGPPPIELWPILCIYFFCLFRYRFYLLLGDAFQKFIPDKPVWLGTAATWTFIIGLPWCASYIIEAIRPVIHGTAYFMRLQGGVPEPEDDAITFLIKAGSQLLFCAILGFFIQQYVKYVGETLIILLCRFKPELSDKYRESLTLFLSAAAFVLIIKIASIPFMLLTPSNSKYAAIVPSEPAILARITILTASILLGLLLFRLPAFAYHSFRKRKPQQPVYFHFFIGITTFLVTVLILYFYFSKLIGPYTYDFSFGSQLFIMFLNIPLLGFVAAILVEGLINTFAEAPYSAIPTLLRPLILSVVTALLIVVLYFIAAWP